MIASFNTTKRQPPTTVLPHFSCNKPFEPLVPTALATNLGGSEYLSRSPMAAEIAGKKSAPMVVPSIDPVDQFRRASSCRLRGGGASPFSMAATSATSATSAGGSCCCPSFAPAGTFSHSPSFPPSGASPSSSSLRISTSRSKSAPFSTRWRSCSTSSCVSPSLGLRCTADSHCFSRSLKVWRYISLYMLRT
jgi:hypothetical protein